MNTIDVDVKTHYLPDQSIPENKQFVYAYTITITNTGDEEAQLISRHWIISDANNKVQEVQGMGVVGEQPTLAPNESYTYTSGVVMETPSGIMGGSYTMQRPSGEKFLAEIPQFALVQPHAVH